MTRRDLEEAILNLEYLLAHDFDPQLTEEHEQRLHELREELRTLTEPRYSLAAHGGKS